MSTQEEIIEMVKKAGISTGARFVGNELVECVTIEVQALVKLVADKKEAEMQERIDKLHNMYELVCKQRDELMDQQRAMVAAMRGQIQ